MKNKNILLTVAVVILVGLTVRTVDGVQHEKELSRLNVEIENLNEKLKELEEDQSDFKYYGGLLYHNVEESEKRLLVVEESQILALPYEGAVVLREIPNNTLVTVLDKVSAQNEAQDSSIWYYVRIPVYDTPMDHTGWIRLEDTTKYTKDNYMTLQSDVSVKIGSTIFESFEFPSFDETDYSYKSEYEIGGRKEETQDGYVRISAAGGVDYWVNEKDIIYPSYILE